tara:strand:+ start:726 stop:1592 length:867 start_codon:yes stop_codon:yes gene_type:complete
MSSKTKKKSSTVFRGDIDDIPDDLDSLNRTQLQKLAKKHGIPANSKSETIKTNLKKYTIKSKLTGVTRLDTQLPRDMQDLVFEKVYGMANPEIEAKIKWILDKKSYPGDDYIVYNYSKIRKKLGVKHNFKPKDLQDKVEYFRHKYVRLGVIHHYFQIEEIIEYFDFIDGENEYAREEENFDSYFRKLREAETNLRTAIKKYNIAAKKLKEFDSYLKVVFIDNINKFINNFRKVAKFDKKLGNVPFLKYGTSDLVSINSKYSSRKTKSLREYVKKSSRTKTRSRMTRSI